MQFLARDQPEALLTVPAGFRPAVDVTWEVSARPVRTDGTLRPDQPEHRVFRIRVDTEGRVRYVDDAGVDGAGYLGYRTALAWPLAGTEPRVCDRHQNIREGILAAVQALEDAAVSCSQVDWARLARIRTLSLDTLSANFVRHDLLGLTNLAALQVMSGSRATYPDDLLAHTPRLQTLRIEGNALEDLPGDLFRYTPRLAHLALGSDSRQDLVLPVDLLAHTPHLESLQLEGRHPAKLARQLLARTPRLTRLTVTPSTPLPETFLAAVPQLTHLTVRDGLEPCATPELLASVPHLRHFAVRMSAEDEKLTCLGRALRLHAPALTELHVELRGLQELEAEVLPELPRLARLTLDAGGLTDLPAHLLAEAPRTDPPQTTQRDAGRGPGLCRPVSWRIRPRLTSLSLRADRLPDLPPDLLAPVPDLRQVQLVTKDMTSLPCPVPGPGDGVAGVEYGTFGPARGSPDARTTLGSPASERSLVGILPKAFPDPMRRAWSNFVWMCLRCRPCRRPFWAMPPVWRPFTCMQAILRACRMEEDLHLPFCIPSRRVS